MKHEGTISEWLPGSPATVHVPVNGERIDLNGVGFEDLLDHGISVGQAARFISQRERRGGIKAINEIDGFYGLAPGVRDTLRTIGRV
jgi:hypothetical protein